jgi:predicted phosphoribosyltransferase
LIFNTIDNTKTVILAMMGSAQGATLIAATRWIKNKNYSQDE